MARSKAETHILEDCAAAIEWVQKKSPRIQCVTNTIAEDITANTLLAVGAEPSMILEEEELLEFATGADALIVNLGTLDEKRMSAANRAFNIAEMARKPILLDPISAHRTRARLKIAQEFLGRQPTVLKANEVEHKAMENPDPSAAPGVVCFVVTGPINRVITNDALVRCYNYAELSTRVAGLQCALGGLITALLAVGGKSPIASLAGLIWFNMCAEETAKFANGPGTFAAHFLDRLHEYRPDDVMDAEIEIVLT